MKQIQDLNIGDVLDNNQLMSIFQCSSQGGMRRSRKTNTLVIVSNRVKSIYIDRWNDDVLYYAGMGTEGDQSFDFRQNRTLFHSGSSSISVYLFEVYVETQYTFMGQVVLSDKPFFETQIDVNNKERKVCIFPLKIISENILFIDKNILDRNNEIRMAIVKRMSNNSLLLLARKGSKNPGNRFVRSKQYERNEAVAEFSKRLAKGVCLLCGENGPFMTKDGDWYLEIHHIHWLSEGGSDTIENTAALCPNCHRKMHVVNDDKDRKYLIETVKKILSQCDQFE